MLAAEWSSMVATSTRAAKQPMSLLHRHLAIPELLQYSHRSAHVSTASLPKETVTPSHVPRGGNDDTYLA